MEYLRHLFRFKRYPVDRNQIAVVIASLELDTRRRIFSLSNSERYLALWERGPDLVTISSEFRYVETEVIGVIYDLENGTAKPIPRERIVRGITSVEIHFSPDEKSAMLFVSNESEMLVTWWNLETGNIIRTVSDHLVKNHWTLTNDYLFERCFGIINNHYPNTEKSEYVVAPMYQRQQFFHNGHKLVVDDGEIIVVKIGENPLMGTVFRNSRIAQYLDLDILPVLRGHLIMYSDESFDVLKYDTVTTRYFHEDIKDFVSEIGKPDPYTEYLSRPRRVRGVIMFQKKTLIRLAGLLLSETSVYKMLPNTLKYTVSEIITI